MAKHTDAIGTEGQRRPPRVDAVERRIIEILQEDGRTSAADLARQVGVSELTARRKLNRLLDGHVIRVIATVDPFDIGYEAPVIIGLKVEHSKIDKVAAHLCSIPSVRYVGASAGRMDLIVEVVAAGMHDLAEFVLKELAAIDGVEDSETNLIVRIYKQSWKWGVTETGPREAAPPRTSQKGEA